MRGRPRGLFQPSGTAAHSNIPAGLEGDMSWGLWVHASDVAKEAVPALLDEVANVNRNNAGSKGLSKETAQKVKG